MTGTGSQHQAVGAGDALPHGTTIVAVVHTGGVVMAGDRRATMGNVIAQRDIEKVFPADDYSVVGIAGTAGLAVEMVRLFQVELEHYEKMEGHVLSLDGKANRLSTMIRGNLGMAMQGLAVVPLFAGFDDVVGDEGVQVASDGRLGEAHALGEIRDRGGAVVQDGARDAVARRALTGREFLLRSPSVIFHNTIVA